MFGERKNGNVPPHESCEWADSWGRNEEREETERRKGIPSLHTGNRKKITMKVAFEVKEDQRCCDKLRASIIFKIESEIMARLRIRECDLKIEGI